MANNVASDMVHLLDYAPPAQDSQRARGAPEEPPEGKSGRQFELLGDRAPEFHVRYPVFHPIDDNFRLQGNG